MKKLTEEEILIEWLNGNKGRNLTERVAIIEGMREFANQEVNAAIEKSDKELREFEDYLIRHNFIYKGYKNGTLIKQFLHSKQTETSLQPKIKDITEMFNNLERVLEKNGHILQQPNPRSEIEKLRDDIEKCTESLDLISDSDIIQIYGSIIGRLNLILNS